MSHNLQHLIKTANKLSGVENPTSFSGNKVRRDVAHLSATATRRAIAKSKGKKSALHGRKRPTR